MIKTKATVTTMTTRTHEHVVSGECFRHMLSQLLGEEVPPHAEIVVRVPGGGDWSNCDLDIDANPIHVAWTTVTES